MFNRRMDEYRVVVGIVGGCVGMFDGGRVGCLGLKWKGIRLG